MKRAKPAKAPGKSVAYVGAGGNIGSHGVAHLGRMRQVRRVVLVDSGVYEEKNLVSQDITPSDVGKAKAKVQGERLRRINPALEVVAIHDRVENVPLAQLRCDVILTGLDSREARRAVNAVSWRLNMAWVDAGVEAGGLLARVNVYVPGPDAPCLECAWDDRDYDALDQHYPCLDDPPEAPSTNAPSSLGALAASLQAIECQKLLAGQWDRVAVGRQILIDASWHKHYVTAFRRNSRTCRFDHQVWKVEKVHRHPGEITVGEALDLGRKTAGGRDHPSLRVEGQVFVRKLTCSACGGQRVLLRLRWRLSPKQGVCGRCGGEMVAGGNDMLDKLEAGRLPTRALKRSLKSLGLRPGDVFTVRGPAGEKHYELDGL